MRSGFSGYKVGGRRRGEWAGEVGGEGGKT